MNPPCILKIALPDAPIRDYFDYLPPENTPNTIPPLGIRVEVPFGRGKKVGLLIEVASESEVSVNKLKPALRLIDEEPIARPPLLKLIKWASQYYHYPLGEVIKNALPKGVQLGLEKIKKINYQIVTEKKESKLTKQQAQLFSYIEEYEKGVSLDEIKAAGFQERTLLALQKKECIIEVEPQETPVSKKEVAPIPLDLQDEQKQALEIIQEKPGFQTFLLDGITGSGKTEIYLQSIQVHLEQQKQVLILVPEISLTPQTINRFKKRFPQKKMVVFHSKCNETEKLRNWWSTYSGETDLIIGTRSALFAPFKNLAMIVIDEEHDPSFKQQSGFRYSAKDLAIIRAQFENIPIILGSATPSLESLYNVTNKNFTHLTLTQRANQKKPPTFYLVDIKSKKLDAGLSVPIMHEIEKHLKNNSQVLVFLNRRGFSPVLLCHSCGWMSYCKNCDAKMVWHQSNQRLFCHHCGFSQTKPTHCPSCTDSTLMHLGTGTERLEKMLSERFKEYPIIRVDKDTTRLKGSMESILEQIKAGGSQVLVGTQMLAKGHHFPNLTMVAILDGDSGLYSADFKAGERMAQMITQVAGRAGRGEKPGEVYIQTHHPDHPWLQNLIRKGYGYFAKELLAERQLASFPPYHHLAIIRAEAKQMNQALQFLNKIKQKLNVYQKDVSVSPAIPAWMEKKANVYRAVLLINASNRSILHQHLKLIREDIQTLRRPFNWSLEIDPSEIL